MTYRRTIPVNKAKMIATYGPSVDDKDTLLQMIFSGLDVIRFNFSHGSHEDHARGMDLVRSINEEYDLNIAILADLQGPKIRLGEVDYEHFEIEDGDTIELTNTDGPTTPQSLHIRYDHLHADLDVGHRVLIDDGKVRLKVTERTPDTLIATVIHGGPIKSRKGVNLPDSSLSVPSLTEKDRADLAFALDQEVNWIALSFVRKADDVAELADLLGDQRSFTKIIAKIEKPEAVRDIDNILRETDAIMVARGDLGVEIPQERVPLVQKDIINRCIRQAKPVIVATQMMESMIEHPVATRAEINDVANAVIDGADAVMLSGETSVGKHPVLVVQTMQKILANVERSSLIYHKDLTASPASDTYLSDAVCYNAAQMARDLRARAIIGMTRSGYTAFMISSCRPKAHIFIFTDNRPLLKTLNLFWGVRAFYYSGLAGTDQTINDVIEILKRDGLLKKHDVVINTASMPLDQKGRTNMVKVSVVKDLENS